MNPDEVFSIVEQDTAWNWGVFLNSVCLYKSANLSDIKQFIASLKMLNQGKEIIELEGEEVALNPDEWLPTE